jgi:hypothetical protein
MPGVLRSRSLGFDELEAGRIARSEANAHHFARFSPCYPPPVSYYYRSSNSACRALGLGRGRSARRSSSPPASPPSRHLLPEAFLADAALLRFSYGYGDASYVPGRQLPPLQAPRQPRSTPQLLPPSCSADSSSRRASPTWSRSTVPCVSFGVSGPAVAPLRPGRRL